MNRMLLSTLAVLGLLAFASSAQAREAYVANSAGASVSVFETFNSALVTTIAVGAGPTGVAISPDGSRAYVTNSKEATVSVIDTGTKSTVGSPIPVGEGPSGIAVAPGGTRAYVANSGSDSVSVIETATNSVVATVPLVAGSEPEGVAIAPDGATVYVAQKGGDVARIVTATNALAAPVLTSAGFGPFGLSFTPDGQRVFVTNSNSSSVSVFGTATATILGSPILVGANPAGIAVNTNGPRTYVAAKGADSVVAIDTSTHTSVGSPIPGFQAPAQIAIAPDGARAYVTNEADESVTVLDTLANAGVGKIGVGAEPRGIAIVPDQGPKATFSITSGKVKAEKVVTFDASASTDADGRIATYAWDFGDGEQETTGGPITEHVYAKAGTYTATLTVTDAEGCSSAQLYTGQTVSCNGSGAAVARESFEAVDATPPSFGLFAGPRQPLRRYVIVVGRCPVERCRAEAQGRVASAFKSAKRVVRAKGQTRTARTLLVNGIEQRLKLQLPGAVYRAARRALKAGGRAAVKVSASALDQAGNARKQRATIRLYIPNRRATTETQRR